MKAPWSPGSWRKEPIAQEVVYADCDLLEKVVGRLAKLPPLVTSWEVETLKSQLAEASRGERFLLQGGDCAESFHDCRSHPIASISDSIRFMETIAARSLTELNRVEFFTSHSSLDRRERHGMHRRGPGAPGSGSRTCVPQRRRPAAEL